MERYYVCNCPNCGKPKYSKAKRMNPAALKRMQEWECYSCSKSNEKNPCYGKPKTVDWIKTVSEKNTGHVGYWASKQRTLKSNKKTSESLLKAYEAKKRIPYIDNNNESKTYIVDFYDPINRILIEVKPLSNIKDNHYKTSAAKQYCLENNIEFLIISEDTIQDYINETIFDGQNKLQLNKCYATRKRT